MKLRPRLSAQWRRSGGPNRRRSELARAGFCGAGLKRGAGFRLWAGKVTGLDFGSQEGYIVLAGAGMGLMLGPANTDAVNRASKLSYGEATGITQTVRNYAASLGLAILGTVLVSQTSAHVVSSLLAKGVQHPRARRRVAALAVPIR